MQSNESCKICKLWPSNVLRDRERGWLKATKMPRTWREIWSGHRNVFRKFHLTQFNGFKTWVVEKAHSTILNIHKRLTLTDSVIWKPKLLASILRNTSKRVLGTHHQNTRLVFLASGFGSVLSSSLENLSPFLAWQQGFAAKIAADLLLLLWPARMGNDTMIYDWMRRLFHGWRPSARAAVVRTPLDLSDADRYACCRISGIWRGAAVEGK